MREKSVQETNLSFHKDIIVKYIRLSIQVAYASAARSQN